MKEFLKSMKEFKENAQSNIIDEQVYEVFSRRNTKDKAAVKNKIKVVEDLMLEYLHLTKKR